jgi:hypothetical protein
MKRIFLPILLYPGRLLSACSGARGPPRVGLRLSANEDTAFVAYNQHVCGGYHQRHREMALSAQPTTRSLFASPHYTDGQLLAGGYDHTSTAWIRRMAARNGLTFRLGRHNGCEDRYVGSPWLPIRTFCPKRGWKSVCPGFRGSTVGRFTTERSQWAKPVSDPACTCIYLPRWIITSIR